VINQALQAEEEQVKGLRQKGLSRVQFDIKKDRNNATELLQDRNQQFEIGLVPKTVCAKHPCEAEGFPCQRRSFWHWQLRCTRAVLPLPDETQRSWTKYSLFHVSFFCMLMHLLQRGWCDRGVLSNI